MCGELSPNSRVKPGDLLKYLWYKYILMDPLKAILTPVFLLLISTSFAIPHFPMLALLELMASTVCLILILAVRRKRLNDYLILVRSSFSPYFYLYQSVRKSCALPSDYCEARAVYLSQMRETLEQLPAGRYRTVTQPMFTRAILRSPRIKVVRRKKAYRKTIGKLIREVYSFRTCPTSKAFKQFYFVDFEKEGAI